MNFAVVWSFVAILLAAPLSALTPDSIERMWQQAAQQVSTSAPSPGGSVIVANASPAPAWTWPAEPQDPATAGPATPGPVASATAAPPAWGAPVSGAWTFPPTTPIPVETAAPVALNPLPRPSFGPHQLPGYSDDFTAANNPFHTPFAELVSQGAMLLPHAYADSLMAQGYYTADAMDDIPVFVSRASDPPAKISCTFYSAGGCSAQGMTIHVPANAFNQGNSDSHLIVHDYAIQAEFNGWGCKPPAGGAFVCRWGGWYPFAGKGLENTGNGGVHAGYAVGLFTITADDLLRGRIDHAIGLNTECLTGRAFYPADQRNPSDLDCGTGEAANQPNPAPPYGALVHLNLTRAQLAARGYGYTCQVILGAMNEFGAYTYDTGNRGLAILIDNARTEPSAHAWASSILPQAAKAHDMTASGGGFAWNSCLSRITAADLDIYRVPNMGY